VPWTSTLGHWAATTLPEQVAVEAEQRLPVAVATGYRGALGDSLPGRPRRVPCAPWWPVGIPRVGGWTRDKPGLGWTGPSCTPTPCIGTRAGSGRARRAALGLWGHGAGAMGRSHIVSSWRSPGNVTCEVPANRHKTDFRYFIFILGCACNDQKCLQIGTFLEHRPDTAPNRCKISRSRQPGCCPLEFCLTFQPRFLNSQPQPEPKRHRKTGTLVVPGGVSERRERKPAGVSVSNRAEVR
jgi:hypothetical protein